MSTPQKTNADKVYVSSLGAVVLAIPSLLLALAIAILPSIGAALVSDAAMFIVAIASLFMLWDGVRNDANLKPISD